MSKYLLAVAGLLLALGGEAFGQSYVRGYTRSSGTYVAPYYRSYPDHTTYNNYSTYPNVNPYTGSTGTRHYTPSYTPSYSHYSTPSYSIPSYSAPSYTLPNYSTPSYRSYYLP